MQKLFSDQYFARQSRSEIKPKAMVAFLLAACVLWGIHIAAEVAFPSLHWVPYLIRTAITLVASLLLLWISIRLLEQNGFPAEVLGLSPSRHTLPSVLLGLLTAVAPLVFMQALLRVFVDFHFTRGPLHALDVAKESLSYFAGNSLEEWMFRGFLLLILCRVAGWRTAVAAVALLFGVFHLQGAGLNLDSFRIVISTAIYSVLFSLSYLLTESLWTAVTAHVTSNILLHSVFGLDGMGHALLVPVVSGPRTRYYDLGFWALVLGGVVGCCLLYAAVSHRLRSATRGITARQRRAMDMQ